MHSTEELKALIQSHRVKTQSNRLSPELKNMVTSAFRASWAPLAAFSRAIGVAPMSVLKWSKDSEEKGRLFELIIGLELLRMPGHLYYWREDQHEVDFVYKRGRKIWAIEVKSGRKKGTKGLMKFKEALADAELLMVSPDNYRVILQSIRAN